MDLASSCRVNSKSSSLDLAGFASAFKDVTKAARGETGAKAAAMVGKAMRRAMDSFMFLFLEWQQKLKINKDPLVMTRRGGKNKAQNQALKSSVKDSGR